jgi:hypothetical protein
VVLAEELARRGAGLILVARRTEALEELAGRLRTEHGVQAQVHAADLSKAGEPERLFESTRKSGIEVAVLANNAGYGAYGTFESIDPAVEEGMIDLDIKAVLRLTRLFIPGMRTAGFGRVLLTASFGAFSPGPLYAVYSAAKAFVLSYGIAIRHELRGTGVTVTILSPGIVRTEFHRVAGHTKNRFKERTGMQAGAVGRAAIRALLSGKAEVVPGLLTKVLVFSTRLFPRPVQAAIAARLME